MGRWVLFAPYLGWIPDAMAAASGSPHPGGLDEAAWWRHQPTRFGRLATAVGRAESEHRFSTRRALRRPVAPSPHLDPPAPVPHGPGPAGVVIARLGGMAPVIAEGTASGYPFHFRARRSAWTFSVALWPGTDAVAVGCIGDDGTVVAGFHREGAYGDGSGFAASVMPDEDARRLICACAEELARHVSGSGA